MDMLFFYWLIKALLFVILEISNPGLFLFLSFSVGASVGAVLNFFDYALTTQVVAAFAVSMLVFIVLSVWIRSKFKDKRISHISNIDALMGKKGVVVEHISASAAGALKVNGVVWSARSDNGNEIPVGTAVTIVNVKGVTLCVIPCE
jgi:membrane protein implicated in regulation of membrane protease activity